MAEYTLDDLIEAMEYIDSEGISTFVEFIDYSKLYNHKKWLDMLNDKEFYSAIWVKLRRKKNNICFEKSTCITKIKEIQLERLRKDDTTYEG